MQVMIFMLRRRRRGTVVAMAMAVTMLILITVMGTRNGIAIRIAISTDIEIKPGVFGGSATYCCYFYCSCSCIVTSPSNKEHHSQ